jgi:hypothetical protein
VSFALSNLRVSKLLELNPHDNQGVRFLLHDLDEGLSWEEGAARDVLIVQKGVRSHHA